MVSIEDLGMDSTEKKRPTSWTERVMCMTSGREFMTQGWVDL